MSLRAIKYENGTLEILDQLLLPTQGIFIELKGIEDGWSAINKTQVRGESAIAIVASLSLALELSREDFDDKRTLRREIEGKVNYLLSANPTAPIMRVTADKLITLANNLCMDKSQTTNTMKRKFIEAIEGLLEKDIADNKAIGHHGAQAILTHCLGDNMATVLTHGNTGSLATAGWGTALGVIRTLHIMKKLGHVYCTETRSSNAGAYLTAFELVHDQIPATLIIDSCVGILMKKRRINAVIVGAYTIAINGDTANEIGTYQMAVLAKAHRVPFYIATPFSSIDRRILNGDRIIITEELVRAHVITAKGIASWNPAYDITPSAYITAIITEKGVFKARELTRLKF